MCAKMEIRRSSVHFPRLRGSGPRTITQAINFNREVQRAIAGLDSFSTGFRGDDHHIGLLDIRLATSIDDDVVRVTATFGIRDWSGNWDDDYEGTVQFSVLADLVPITATPPRGDISITGMEISQATQSFRSFEHLSGIYAKPDNSTLLIARKETGVRIYVDYDANSGLPIINSLSGTLEVKTSLGSTTFDLTPFSTITPRRDISIDRGETNHTLNFWIPEGWCQGELTLRARVFDAADVSQRSGLFERTIRFREREPLRVYGVGVNYTGQGLNLSSPSITDFLNTMDFTELTYPVPEAFLTGYTDITFNEDMQANIQDGCGDGFSELLDRLEDIRGDSSDICYGILPLGVNTGSVGGCGRNGVGAGFVNGGTTAAHEIGHAFGRKHAPCDSGTRCDDPAREDDNYPAYDGFASDSIGEYGYNPTTNEVHDPADTYDFMGYSFPTWVSPYSYQKLMSKFPAISGPSPTSLWLLRAAYAPKQFSKIEYPEGEWMKKKMMTLFLRLRIDREHVVNRLPSFHFPAYPARPVGIDTDFVVEIVNADGKVLTCQQLISACPHCRPKCWPKKFSQQIPFPPEGKILIIREGNTNIHEEEIPDPPEVQLKAKFNSKAENFDLSWEVVDRDEHHADYWYLVQWQDEDNAWRGLMPRTQEPKATIPLNLFRNNKELNIRVLATSGIATGVAEFQLEIDETPPESVTIIETTSGFDDPSFGVIKATVVDSTGRSVPDSEIIWHDDEGREIGRGRTFNLGQLSIGQHVVRAVALNQGPGGSESDWLVERLSNGTFKYFREKDEKDSDQPPNTEPDKSQRKKQ